MLGTSCVYYENMFCQEPTECFKCPKFLKKMAETLGVPVDKVLSVVAGVKRVEAGPKNKRR